MGSRLETYSIDETVYPKAQVSQVCPQVYTVTLCLLGLLLRALSAPAHPWWKAYRCPAAWTLHAIWQVTLFSVILVA